MATGTGTGTASDPYLLSTSADLSLVNSYPSAYFKMINDITYTTALTAFVFTGTFSGNFNGNGYTINGITCSSTTASNVSLFDTITGSVYNLGIDYAKMTASTSYSTFSLICREAMSPCKIYDISAVVSGSTVQAEQFYGFIALLTSGTTIHDCYGRVSLSGIPYGQSNVAVRLFANSVSSHTGSTFQNNIMHILGWNYNTSGLVYGFLNGTLTLTSSTFSGNYWYLDSKDGTNISYNSTGGVVREATLANYQTGYGMGSFDSVNTWLFQSDQEPQLRAFIKQVIQTVTQTVISYTNKINSDVIKDGSKLKSVISFSKKIASNLLKTKKVEKTPQSFSKKISSALSMSTMMKRLKQVSSFVGKVNSNDIKSAKIARILKSFASPIVSNDVVSRFRKIVVNSYSGTIKGLVSRFSNVYQTAKVIVNGHVNAIVSNVERKAFVQRLTTSYSKAITSLTSVFYKLGQIPKIVARIKYKLSQISLFKKENKTKVSVEDNTKQ